MEAIFELRIEESKSFIQRISGNIVLILIVTGILLAILANSSVFFAIILVLFFAGVQIVKSLQGERDFIRQITFDPSTVNIYFTRYGTEKSISENFADFHMSIKIVALNQTRTRYLAIYLKKRPDNQTILYRWMGGGHV
jgi:hypothetical protein